MGRKAQSPSVSGAVTSCPQHAKVSWTTTLVSGKPSHPDVFHFPLKPWSPAVSPWIFGSIRPCSVTLDPQVHEPPLCDNGPSFPWGPVVSQWPLVSMRPCSVRMVSLVPQGPAEALIEQGLEVPQWSPGLPEAPQCHNGSLFPWDPVLLHEFLLPWGSIV